MKVVNYDLHITPVNAKLTRNTEWVGKMDPYCIVKVGNLEYQTKTHKNGGFKPEWEKKDMRFPNVND